MQGRMEMSHQIIINWHEPQIISFRGIQTYKYIDGTSAIMAYLICLNLNNTCSYQLIVKIGPLKALVIEADIQLLWEAIKKYVPCRVSSRSTRDDEVNTTQTHLASSSHHQGWVPHNPVQPTYQSPLDTFHIFWFFPVYLQDYSDI